MTKLTAGTPVDMTKWTTQFADSTGAPIGDHDASHMVAGGATHDYRYTGDSFDYFSPSDPTPVGGQLHGLTVANGLLTYFTISEADVLLTKAYGYLNAGNWNKFESYVFAGRDSFYGSKGADHFLGFNGNDTFNLAQGGNDTAEGGNGNDTFNFGATFTADDRAIGGAGADTVVLSGGYEMTIGAHSLVDIETLKLEAGARYELYLRDASIGDGGLVVNATALLADDELYFSMVPGSVKGVTVHAGGGQDYIFGGAGADEINGAGGIDYLVGLKGADIVTGGKGKDTFAFANAADSTSINHDVLTDFTVNMDKIGLNAAVTGVDDPIDIGSLNPGSFDDDFAEWVNAHTLAKHHAVLFTPEHGELGGTVFIVVDMNGKAGYQAGKDLILEMGDHAVTAGLDMHDFYVPS